MATFPFISLKTMAYYYADANTYVLPCAFFDWVFYSDEPYKSTTSHWLILMYSFLMAALQIKIVKLARIKLQGMRNWNLNV